MKRTTVKYRKTVDGHIELMAIENVATRKEIEEEFGKEVARLYFGSLPSYRKADYNLLCANGEFLDPGILSKEKFESLIKIMKAAGKRLQEIKKAIAAHKDVFEIEI